MVRMTARRRNEPAFGDKAAHTVICGRGTSGNDVRHRATAQRHPHVFAAADSTHCLTERPLQVAYPNHPHVTTISLRGHFGSPLSGVGAPRLFAVGVRNRDHPKVFDHFVIRRVAGVFAPDFEIWRGVADTVEL